MKSPFLIALLTLAISGCTTTSASAGWPHDQFENQPRAHRHYRPAKHRHHHKPRAKVIYRTVTPSMTPGPLQDAPRCQPAFRTVGDQAATFSLARAAAEKAWSQQARFSFGERYNDPANARDVTFECIKSGTGSITGDWFNRCEMRARPCMAPQVGADK